jgi:hypothetical protein
MAEQNQPEGPKNPTTAELERHKLALEIEKLKQQNRLIERLGTFVPVLTTLVAVAGLFLSFLSFQSARQTESETRALDRANRIQIQIRADKEEVLKFPTKEEIFPSGIGFLIDDLKTLIAQLGQDSTDSAAAEQAQTDTTNLLIDMAWGLRYDQAQHFSFDYYAVSRWKAYREWWKTHPDEHRYFLENKYHSEITRVRNDKPSCIEKLNYKPGTTILAFDQSDHCDEDLIGALIYSYGQHLIIMSEARQLDFENELQEFARLTNSDFATTFRNTLQKKVEP